MSGSDVLGWALVAFLVAAVVVIELVLWRRRRRRPKPTTTRASNLDALAHLYKRYYNADRIQKRMMRPGLNFASLRKWTPPLPPNHDPGDEDRS